MARKPTDFAKKRKKMDKPKITYQSRLVFENGKELWEQVFDGTTSQYAVWDGKKVKYKQMLELDTETIKPINDDTLKEGAVILPKRAEEYGSTTELLEEIREFVHDYVDISTGMEHLASWYVLLTWISDKLKTICYLRARGDTGVGKTRFEDTIGYLCYHAIKAAGCVTPAPIYRLIRLWRGTLIIDEADFRRSDESAEVIKILNCGFQKSTPVIRCDKNNPEKLQILPTFGPKILATRQAFYDKALESRCLTEIMRKTIREDIPVDLPKAFFERAQTIRNKCLMFRFRNYHKIDPDVGLDIDFGRLEPRIKQAVISFPALFHNDPEVMEDFKKFIQKHQQEIIDERSISFDGVMINCLAEMILEQLGIADGDDMEQQTLANNQKGIGNVILTSSEIAEKMGPIYGTKDKIYARVVGRHLKSMGLVTKPKKVEGKTKRVVDLSDTPNLTSIFRSYIVDETLLKMVTSVSSVTSPMGGEDDVTYIYKRVNALGRGYIKASVPHVNETNVTDVTFSHRKGVKSTPKMILEIIRKMPKTDDGLVEIQGLANVCNGQGISELDVDDALVVLKRDGTLFEPRNGFVGVIK